MTQTTQKREACRGDPGSSGKGAEADLNAASNKAHRVGYKVMIKKIESCRAAYNRVKSATPSRGARDPSVETPPF